MNLLEAKGAVIDFVAAQWTATPVIWPNETKKAPKQPSDPHATWIACEFLTLGEPETHLGGVGKRLARDDGILNAHVFVPVVSGDAQAWQAAFDFGELFRLRKIGGLQFYSPRVQPIGKQDNDLGNWFGVTTAISWSLTRTV